MDWCYGSITWDFMVPNSFLGRPGVLPRTFQLYWKSRHNMLLSLQVEKREFYTIFDRMSFLLSSDRISGNFLDFHPGLMHQLKMFQDGHSKNRIFRNSLWREARPLLHPWTLPSIRSWQPVNRTFYWFRRINSLRNSLLRMVIPWWKPQTSTGWLSRWWFLMQPTPMLSFTLLPVLWWWVDACRAESRRGTMQSSFLLRFQPLPITFPQKDTGLVFPGRCILSGRINCMVLVNAWQRMFTPQTSPGIRNGNVLM